VAPDSSDGVYAGLRQALISGAAVVVPFVITLIVLSFVFNFLYQILTDFTRAILLVPGVSENAQQFIINVSVPVFLFLLVLAVGIVVERTDFGEDAFDAFDDAISVLPGVGSIYDSFRKMSDVVMRSDEENFRDVKVVEFPNEEVYTLGFLTTRTPKAISEPTAHEGMMTLFLPLAPNPVMGGHLVHVPENRVMDVDMTVEEAMQTVVTTGVALGGAEGAEGLSQEELRGLAGGDVGRHDGLGEE
jgi:uncharacterized membrane protein